MIGIDTPFLMVFVVGIILLCYICTRLYIVDLQSDFQKMANERDKWFYKYQMVSNLYFYEKGVVKILQKTVPNLSIAIYGLDDVGNHLFKILKRNGFTVQYGIDQGGGKIWYPNIEVHSLQDILPKTDLIIITLDKYTYPFLKDTIISKHGRKCEYLQVLLIEAWSDNPCLILS